MSEARKRLLEWLRYQAGDYTGRSDYDGLCNDVKSVLDELDGIRKDAERYRKIRNHHWNDGGYVIVAVGSVKLGSDCASGDRLDYIMDAWNPPPGPLANHGAASSD